MTCILLFLQVHSLSLVLRKKTNELAKANVSKLLTHMEMIGVYGFNKVVKMKFQVRLTE